MRACSFSVTENMAWRSQAIGKMIEAWSQPAQHDKGLCGLPEQHASQDRCHLKMVRSQCVVWLQTRRPYCLGSAHLPSGGHPEPIPAPGHVGCRRSLPAFDLGDLGCSFPLLSIWKPQAWVGRWPIGIRREPLPCPRGSVGAEGKRMGSEATVVKSPTCTLVGSFIVKCPTSELVFGLCFVFIFSLKNVQVA